MDISELRRRGAEERQEQQTAEAAKYSAEAEQLTKNMERTIGEIRAIVDPYGMTCNVRAIEPRATGAGATADLFMAYNGQGLSAVFKSMISFERDQSHLNPHNPYAVEMAMQATENPSPFSSTHEKLDHAIIYGTGGLMPNAGGKLRDMFEAAVKKI